MGSVLVDTHCHIHDDEYSYDIDKVLDEAREAGVGQLICIGTSASDSQKAVDFVADRPGLWCSIGLHPHDAKVGEDDFELLTRLAYQPKVVAIGEFGLDYHYDNSPREAQKTALEFQLQLAMSANLPCIFHVRKAFDDFWPIFDNFPGLRGVLHSYTDDLANMEQALKRNLYFGLNGIYTFSKDSTQTEVGKQIPLDKILLETDSPFLTPTPLRGTMNSPANVRLVAAYLAELRGELVNTLIEATTKNARSLLGLNSQTI